MPDTPSSSIQRVGLIFAMHAEGRLVADKLGFGPSEQGLHQDLPAQVRVGRVGQVDLIHCINGIDPLHRVDRIGTETATLVSWLLLERYKPDLLINAGTCGGFKSQGAKIGDTYLASGDFLYHDHRVPIPGFRELGEARIPADPFPVVAEILGLQTGPVSSGASLDATDVERAFFEREGVVAKDMEATAIAAVARDRSTPFLAIKAVTDLVDHPEPSEEAFLRNLEYTTTRLADHLERLLSFLGDGKTIQDLRC